MFFSARTLHCTDGSPLQAPLPEVLLDYPVSRSQESALRKDRASDNIRVVLILKNSHDKEQPAVFEIFSYRVLKHVCRCRIVRTIHDKQRILMDNGKSSVPAGCPKPLFALFQSRMISSLIQDPKSLQCKNCILRLIGAGKRSAYSSPL